VVLKEGLIAKRALALEEALFFALTEDRRTVTYRKYNPKKSEGPYRRSLGGLKPTKKKNYVLYLAWKEKHRTNS
jgi:hypothetical protein